MPGPPEDPENPSEASGPKPPASASSQEELGGQMTFLEHLGELRTRLRTSVIAIIISLVACFGFSEYILEFLLVPVSRAIEGHMAANPNAGTPELQSIDVTGAFWAHFSVSLWAGIFVASPIVFYQVWKFIAPGLYQKEKRWGVLFAVGSAICFFSGALFCYYVVLEPVLQFLLGYSTDRVPIVVNPDALRLVKFIRKILIGFGLCFELPLLITVLALTGTVTHRGLWKFNRWWIVLSALISAILTPPDIFSQVVMAGPLIILYNLSIVIAFFITRRREKRMKNLDI